MLNDILFIGMIILLFVMYLTDSYDYKKYGRDLDAILAQIHLIGFWIVTSVYVIYLLLPKICKG